MDWIIDVWNSGTPGRIGLLVIAGLAFLAINFVLSLPLVRPLVRGLGKLLFALGKLVYRFAAGQVMGRPLTRWDARWESWAPDVPEQVKLQRGETYPRTIWAQRPGWHRQLVRLGSLALAYGWWQMPTLRVVLPIAGAIALVTWSVATLARRRWQRYVDSVCDLWADPVAERIGLAGVPTSKWVALPAPQWVREPMDLPRWSWRLITWLSGDQGEIARDLGERRAGWRAKVAGKAPGLSTRLARVASWAATTAARLAEKVRVPHRQVLDLDDPSARIVVQHPKSWNGEPSEITSLIKGRLAGDWAGEYQARSLQWVFYHPSKMPQAVQLDRSVLDRYGRDEAPIGKTKDGDKFVCVPFEKTPHVSVAAPTGWAKTTTANALLAHQLYHGAAVVILDPKYVGYISAFADLPNVLLRTSLRGMIQAIRQVRDEMNRRYQLIHQYEARAIALGMPSMKEDPDKYFQPLRLVDDEKGSLTVEIKSWWKRPAQEEWELNEDYKSGSGESLLDLPGKPGRGDPIPLLEDQEILWRGRAAGVRRITLAQQNNLNVFLNSDMREQYGFKILAGPQTDGGWRMTFPGTKHVKVAHKKGRAVYGIGAEGTHQIQLGWISDSEARAAAEHGFEVIDKENQERAERLAKVSGHPVGALSPAPGWLTLPAATPSGVPVHAGGGDTGGHDQEPALETASTAASENADRTLHVSTEFDGTSAIVDLDEVVPGADEAPTMIPAGGEKDSNYNDSDSNNENPDHLVGNEAAASHLGLRTEAFVQHIKRDRRANKRIPEEVTRRNGRPVYHRLDLQEWLRQTHPRSARSQGREHQDTGRGEQ